MSGAPETLTFSSLPADYLLTSPARSGPETSGAKRSAQPLARDSSSPTSSAPDLILKSFSCDRASFWFPQEFVMAASSLNWSDCNYWVHSECSDSKWIPFPFHFSGPLLEFGLFILRIKTKYAVLFSWWWSLAATWPSCICHGPWRISWCLSASEDRSLVMPCFSRSPHSSFTSLAECCSLSSQFCSNCANSGDHWWRSSESCAATPSPCWSDPRSWLLETWL